MKAVILCDETLDKSYEKEVFGKFDVTEALIITTENSLQREFEEKYPSWKSQNISIDDDSEFKKAKEMAEIILNGVQTGICDPRMRELAEISINGIYEVYTRIIARTEKVINELIRKYGICEIYLYGGNENIQFLPLNMAEGERPSRFMYKRKWFLNPIIHSLYKGKCKIIWRQESCLKLRAIRWTRLQIMNGGKLYKSFIKYCKTEKVSPVISNEAEYIALVVRTVNHVKSIIPIYRAIKAYTRFTPILIAYENYANNDLVQIIKENRLDYINARQYADFWRILGCFCKAEFCSKVKRIKDIKVCETIDIDNHYFTRELKFQWWDALLLWESFSAAKQKSRIALKAVINMETYNGIAAAQAKWANNAKIPVFGVPFVTLDLRPRVVWTDKYFFMTKDEYHKFLPLAGLEACGYVGPICYDDIYNKTRHERGSLRKILILTQPDGFRSDSIRIIDDVIRVRKEKGEEWDICVKLHPRESDPQFFHNRYEKYGFIRVILNEINSTDLLVSSDLAVGIVSTTLYQSVLIGTPALSVNYNGLVHYSLDVVEFGVVKKVKNYNLIKEYFDDFRTEEIKFYDSREKYLKYALGDYDGKGAKTLAEFLEKEL